ncbi:MAG: SDR family NAD(P)-dependent oxidoreductase [bacterium]
MWKRRERAGDRAQPGDAAARASAASATNAMSAAGAAGDGALAGRCALVTGGARNIGRAIALEMAAQGARIVVLDSDAAACAEVERALAEFAGAHRVVVADVADSASVSGAWADLTRAGFAIDILVNNAAVRTGADSVRGFDRAEWERTFATNVIGPMHLTRLAVEAMIAARRAGSIIFLSSIHQETPRCIPSYSASKAAIGMLVKELAIDLAPHAIRVNAVAPGYVAVDDRGRALAHAPTPLGARAVTPAAVASAVAFLASDRLSPSTTGATLTIDGGLSLQNHLTLRDSK